MEKPFRAVPVERGEADFYAPPHPFVIRQNLLVLGRDVTLCTEAIPEVCSRLGAVCW